MIFKRKKYQYNPDTLTFEEVKTNRKQRMLRYFVFPLTFLALTAISGYIINTFFYSPKSLMLNKQISAINHEMNDLFEKGKTLSSFLQNKFFPQDDNYRLILQIDSIPYPFRMAGTGGSAAEDLYSIDNDVMYRVNNLIAHLTLQLQIQSGSFDTIYKKAQEYSTELSHLPAILPVSRNDLVSISTDFGLRTDPFLFQKQIHNGLDFVAPVGKNVYATGDGIVTFVQYSRKGYGNEVVIDHEFGFGTRYAHLTAIVVKEGDVIKRGQKIGTVGQTGRATGPHLHYEVLMQNKPVNPSFYFDTGLTKEEYTQIINKANQNIN